MAKFCPKCGKQLDDTARFCIGCGERLPEMAEQAAPPIQQPAPPVQAQDPLAQQFVQAAPAPPPAPPFQQAPPPFQQAPPWQQPYSPAGTAKPKSKIKLPVILGAAAGVVILIVVIVIVSVSGALSKAAKADYYTIGNDQIPSVRLALGEERKVTGTSTSVSGGVTTKEIKYQVPGMDQGSDMWDYYNYLHDKDGFLALTDIFFFGETSGQGTVARNSVDGGYYIQLQIDFDRSGYTITVQKLPGEITPKQAEHGERGALTGGIFSILESDTYHIKVDDLMGMGIEIYGKYGMTAIISNIEGVDYRMVTRDGKVYVIMDAYEMIMVSDAEDEEEMMAGLSSLSNMVYVGEGVGEFNGAACPYDEYTDPDGDQYFYFVDGGVLRGIRTVIFGEMSDMAVTVFDQEVPDYVFDIPANYQMLEGE